MATPTSALEQRIKEVYADNIMTGTEFMAMRDEADRLFAELIAKYPTDCHLIYFQKFADEVVQSMQLGILAIKKAKPVDADKAAIKEGFGFQVAYIKASLDRFTQLL